VLGLDEEEQARLHRAMAGTVPAPVVSLSDRRRAQLWLRLGAVAATLVALVGVVNLVGRLSEAPVRAGLEALSEPTTAAAAATTTVLGDVASPAAQAEEGAAFRMAGGDAEAVRAEIDQLLEAARAETLTYNTKLEDDQARRCAELLEERSVAAAALSNLDGRPIIIYILDDGDQPEAIVYDQATCELVELK
jgi:hypothetical protein